MSAPAGELLRATADYMGELNGAVERMARTLPSNDLEWIRHVTGRTDGILRVMAAWFDEHPDAAADIAVLLDASPREEP